MAKPRKSIRYVTEDDQIGLTPSALGRIGRARQVEYVKYWFESRFEDPAMETPYNDGEYLFINGGPYDADEEIQQEFGSFISYDVMKEAIDEVQGDGTFDWAPSHNHPDYPPPPDEDEDNPAFASPPSTLDEILQRLRSGEGTRLGMGTPEEIFERQVLRDHVLVLETALARIRTAPPGPGHNGAPEEDEDDDAAIRRPSLANAVEDVQTIKVELDAATPDVLKVAEAASRLSRFASWIAKRVEKAVEKVIEIAIAGAIVGSATLAAPHVLPTIVPLIHNVEGTVIRWSEYAMQQF